MHHHHVTGLDNHPGGPTVYGITDIEHADAARRAGQYALDAADVDGTVRIVQAQNHGVTVEQLE
jgi:hypothetical protein